MRNAIKKRKIMVEGKTNLKNKTCLVMDFGLFTELAVALLRTFGKVYYFVPWQDDFPSSKKQKIGMDFDGLTRIQDFWDYMDKVDLIVSFDTYNGDLCDYLRKKGYRVFGAGKAESMELERWNMRRMQYDAGLPTQATLKIKSLDDLVTYFRGIRREVKQLLGNESNEAVEATYKRIRTKYDGFSEGYYVGGDKVKLAGEWLNGAQKKFVKANMRGDIECVDDKTEIFTLNGWKLFKDLQQDDLILSMDLRDRHTCFCNHSGFFSSYYKGDMYGINHERVNLLATPNHRLFVKTSGEWQYKQMADIAKMNYVFVPISFDWDGWTSNKETKNYTIKKREKKSWKENDKNVLMNEWLKFLGWFLSEGSLSDHIGKKKSKYRIIISQSKKKNFEKWIEIKNILDNLGYNYQTEGELGFSVYNKTLYKELTETCYEQRVCEFCHKQYCSHLKKVPDYVKMLSSEQIDLLLKSYQSGDGCNDRGHINFYTTSKTLADDIQELVFKTKKTAVILTRDRKVKNWHICYVISVIEKDDSVIQKKDIKKVNYEGWVYDVNVFPFHSIFLRRNGKAFWSGNSFYVPDYDNALSKFNHLAEQFGHRADTNEIEFVIEEEKEGVEPGFDGIQINGEYLSPTSYGYERKGQGYIGRVCDYEDLPEPMKFLNRGLSRIFKQYVPTMSFFSNEFLIGQDRKPYLIDPTVRNPAPVGSAIYCELIENLGEIIWYGSQGIKVAPVMRYKYAAGVCFDSEWAENHELEVEFPPEMRRWFKLRKAYKKNNKYYSIPGFTSIGSVIALGNSIDEVVNLVKQRAEKVKAYELQTETGGLEKVKEEIIEGRKFGISF